LRIGDLNKSIVLQQQTRAADGMGGFTVTWADVDTIWAAIWPLSANETLQAGQTGMTITGRIRIRYRANVRASMRLKYGNRYFNIVSVINPSEGNEMLDLMVKEAVT
jgi:SPP1 family predicted phage head-tail adaptor